MKIWSRKVRDMEYRYRLDFAGKYQLPFLMVIREERQWHKRHSVNVDWAVVLFVLNWMWLVHTFIMCDDYTYPPIRIRWNCWVRYPWTEYIWHPLRRAYCHGVYRFKLWRWHLRHKPQPNGCGYADPKEVKAGLVRWRCGGWRDGRELCWVCAKLAHKMYPQGWRYYPGDICEHRVYVGGCGADCMCGVCEGGYEPDEGAPEKGSITYCSLALVSHKL